MASTRWTSALLIVWTGCGSPPMLVADDAGVADGTVAVADLPPTPDVDQAGGPDLTNDSTAPPADSSAAMDLSVAPADLTTAPADLATGPGDLTTGPGDLTVAPWSFTETFPGADGTPWASRWKVLGGVASSTIVGGRGRIVPITGNYAVGRLGVTDGVRDIEVSYRVLFEQSMTQGVGFYVRQNGGWLQGTTPHGQGYAVFVENFRGSRMGVWAEVDGVETELMPNYTGFATPLQSNVLYGVRFHCKQLNGTTTQLQARIWIASQTEPTTWQIDITDSTPVLQNSSGGMAIDSYTTATSGTLTVGTQVDDVVAGPGQLSRFSRRRGGGAPT